MNFIFVAILLPVLYLTGQLFVHFRSYWMHRRSATWPMVRAKVNASDIGQGRTGDRGEDVTFTLKIEFS